MMEHKTVKVVTDEILDKMSKDGWRVLHLQFDGDVLRGVFCRTVKPVKEVVVPATDGEPVTIGTNSDLYNRSPFRPVVRIESLKPIETAEETIARLDAEVVARVTNWVTQNIKPYQHKPLLREVNS